MFVLMLTACATGAAPGSAAGAPASPEGVTFAGGDGLSCETRVVIRGAAGERDGVAAERAWLRAKYPGSKLRKQSLTKCAEQPADQVAIATSDGRTVDVYFDISDFFGKGFE